MERDLHPPKIFSDALKRHEGQNDSFNEFDHYFRFPDPFSWPPPLSHLERNRKYTDRFMLRWCRHCEELNRAPLSHERGMLTVPRLAKSISLWRGKTRQSLGLFFNTLPPTPHEGFWRVTARAT